VDLLPDRSTESTAQWLRTHPGTEIVSRDRASLYAQAANAGAPDAVQVADRWHLLHNLSEALIGALVPHHRLLIEAARASASKTEAPATLAVLPSVVTKPTSRYQKKQHHNRERRLASYQAVMEQISKGVTQREVAQSCGLGIRTIRRWIRARGFPERKVGDRKSTVDEYSEYLEQRWNEGCHNATHSGTSYVHEVLPANAPIVRTWVRRRYGSRKFRTGQQPSFPLPAASIPTTNSLDVVEGTRERSELSRRTMPQIIGNRDLRFGGTGVRSHHSGAGCRCLEEMERRRKDEPAGQLRKAPLPGRGCTHGRPSISMEQRTSRRTCSPPEANQTLDVRPRQIRSASTPRRKCRMKSSLLQTDANT
jgi:predicted DNA-binding transcriptional regulator AlpA